MMEYLVTYKYDGGRGSEIVTADTADEATRAVMATATPKWNPGAAVTHASTRRILRGSEVASEPNGGITDAVDLSWDKRDRGLDYLIIERGSAYDRDCRSYWLSSGRICGNGAYADGSPAARDRIEKTRSAPRRVR